MKHLGPLALFAGLAIGWTWPLATRLHDALPGLPGDNYSFVWNLWWMRHVLETPGLAYFHTNYLFYPFGTTIADHPHTALPAIVAATLLRSASVVTAQNLLLVGYAFANMAAMYALAWDVVRRRTAAVLAGVVFGLSPYLASHLLGHFDLMAAWLLPLFALFARRATTGSILWAAAAGAVLAATAYTAYYYVVYLGFFLAVYLVAWADWRWIAWSPRVPTPRTRLLRRGLLAAAATLAVLAIWIAASGGATLTRGAAVISMRTPQNALTAIWICAFAYLACGWRPVLTHTPVPLHRVRRALTLSAVVGGVFLAAAAPLIWQAAALVAHGEYVTPAYQWRSAPRGVDLLALLLGPPLNPVFTAAGHAYQTVGLDRIEAVGWLGIVPLLLLGASLAARTPVSRDVRIWRVVGVAFALWALGPILAVRGFDTGLKLPAILLRYVPFVANARMPGRAMVGVFMSMAILGAAELRSGLRWWRPAGVQWLLVALVVCDYWDAPIPLTPLDRPDVYRALSIAPAGAVCDVPFGIGDGLGVTVGTQDRSVLYYATLHEHPLVGGYIGRMPADAALRYEQMPGVGPLLRLSDGRLDPGAAASADAGPCAYFIVHRSTASAALDAYVHQHQLELVARDDSREIYRTRR